MASSLTDPNVQPHDRFFFADGSLYLKVEDTLYCVHKFLFEIHATMFPIPEQQTSLTNPYVLEDVKKPDFDRLLAHLYPRTLGVKETKTAQDWISILALASKWGFDSLRSRAISKIEKTLDSPIDMVTLGRQYSIPNILLPGYAVLCQSTTPLTYEDGLRLGMEDVVNIYRIRHELYGSGVTLVPLEAAFAKVKEAGLGAEHLGHDLDSEQDSMWTDVVSVAASHISTAGILTPDVEFFPSMGANSGVAALMSKRPEQPYIDVHLASDRLTSVGRGNGVSSPVSPGRVSSLNPGSSESTREGLKLVEELTDSNFDLVFVEIMRWLNDRDIQTLHQIMRMIINKAIENPYESSPYAQMCRAMVNYTRPMHQITRLIVEKAMEEYQWRNCASLCNVIMEDYNNYRKIIVTTNGLLFGEYLGEICQEVLEAITALVAVASDHTARVQRLRLIEFIGQLHKAWKRWAPTTIDKWMTALLDPNSEEKVATLCMVMTRASQICTSYDWNGWLQRIKVVGQETSNPRVRTLLQGVKIGEYGRVVIEPDERGYI